MVLNRDEGVWDVDGNRYLDCLAAYSGVLSNTEVLGLLKPGEHGSTFGGNPLACAVARTALRVLVEEGMIENAARQGVRNANNPLFN